MFTLADCALRNVNATTVAASRHPDHHPLVTPAFPGSLQGFRPVSYTHLTLPTNREV